MMGEVFLIAVAALIVGIAAYAKVSTLERRLTELLAERQQKRPPSALSARPLAETATRTAPEAPTLLPRAPWIDEVRDQPLEIRTPPPFQSPPTSVEPLPYKKLLALITGGNPFVRIGVLVLFFGVAFLLKYASEHHHLPPQVRLGGAATLAIVLLVAGWRLRQRVPGYALVLQGGGVGVLYLASFASLRLYHLLPAGVVFLLLCMVVTFSALLAVVQDSIWLAIVSVLGGFLAPVLASTGEGSHVVLFSYYLVLNLGVFGIALYKSWRSLNVLGFLCTFIIATAWGALKYQPEFFASTEPFLIAFFLLYTGITLLYALRQSLVLSHYADGALIFGVPLTAFGLQSAMVHGWEYALAYSALAMGAFYISTAGLIHRLRPRDLRLVAEAFLALGVGFATLAIPFALDAYWTSASWALEGAGIAWAGLRQQRRLWLFSGLLLQLAAGIAFLRQDTAYAAILRPLINSQTLGMSLISVAALFTSWNLQRSNPDPAGTLPSWARPSTTLMFVWGLLWWAYGGLDETSRLSHGDSLHYLNGLLLFVSASLALFCFVSRALTWKMLGLTAVMQMPVMALVFLLTLQFSTHPAAGWGWFAWPAAMVTAFLTLWQLERPEESRPLLRPWHTLNLLLCVAVVTWECDWLLQWPHEAVWHFPLTGIIPAGVLLVLATQARIWLRWPVQRHAVAYTGWAVAILGAYLWLWLLFENFSVDSTRALFPYLPVLNPLDAGLMFALLASSYWLAALRHEKVASLPVDVLPGAVFLTGLTAFVCLNGMLVRTLCYWLPLSFEWQPLMDSQVVQMSLSILWTVSALGLMVFAARVRLRDAWFVGAVLMVLEILKLFVVDLASAGSLERVVSFIVVGGLLLLIGYFSPLPPATGTQDAASVGSR
jgi:uncharacterized membrane protein